MKKSMAYQSPWPIYFIYIWITLWKGLGLWHAAKFQQRNWFIAMIVLYPFTYGLLEIVYLFYFAKHKLTLKDLFFWQKGKNN